MIAPFIDDVGPWLRAREVARHGRAHLQTVSVFGPELIKHPTIAEAIFRHEALDFANTHLYEARTIDDPKDTVAPALAVGRLMRAAVQDACDGRPVFDSEHGPIHRFKDKKHLLPEPFDDEYFRHIQWAHLASGGAGGGMRWPNRHPHVLTVGMRRAQRVLSDFLPLIDWTRFKRRNLNDEIVVSSPALARFGCGDERQAIVWLLRTGARTFDRRVRTDGPDICTSLRIPGMSPGNYVVTLFSTIDGRMIVQGPVKASDGHLEIVDVKVSGDLAIAVTPA